MRDRVLLGTVRSDFKYSVVAGERIFLEKHSWDCGWYWGFGYIGNVHLHTHFDGAFLGGAEINIEKIFVETRFDQNTWWVIRDLFIQAYALKSAAEVYRYGGHQTTAKGITDLIKDESMEKRLNADLELVLNKIWSIVNKEAN